MKKRFSRAKYKNKVITRELWEQWKINYPEYKESSYAKYVEYARKILLEYRNEVTINSDGVRLPFYMGDVTMKFVPVKKQPLNPQVSKQILKEVPYLNFGTNGRVGKVVYSAEHCRLFNRYAPLLGFEPSKEFAKLSREQFKENPELFKDNQFSKSNRTNLIKKSKNNDQS